MKKNIFTICLFIICTNFSFAQETGKWRGGFESGCLFPIEGAFGILGLVELKYNLHDNMNVGLKTEIK
jgi:hypothetical protein